MSLYDDIANPITGTAAQLAVLNPVALLNQFIYITDSGLSKKGDGIRAYNALSFYESQQQFTTCSGTNSYVADLTITGIFGVYVGLSLRIMVSNANTGACTFDFNSIGAQSLIASDGSTPQLTAGGIYEIAWSGTAWQVMDISGTSSGFFQAKVLKLVSFRG